MLFAELLFVFFLIGLLGFGGGYAMLSLIQTQVVTQYHWLTMAEFTNIVAISQMTPGPIGINTATYCGYAVATQAGYGTGVALLSSLAATTALMLPSIILMLIIARLFITYMHHPTVEGMLRVLRPTVVGLLLAAVLLLMNGENFSSWEVSPWQFTISCGLFVTTIIGTTYFKVHPITMLALAAAAGIFLL